MTNPLIYSLRKFSLYSHLGGTAGEDKLADEIHDMWKAQGLDHVTKVRKVVRRISLFIFVILEFNSYLTDENIYRNFIF